MGTDSRCKFGCSRKQLISTLLLPRVLHSHLFVLQPLHKPNEQSKKFTAPVLSLLNVWFGCPQLPLCPSSPSASKMTSLQEEMKLRRCISAISWMSPIRLSSLPFANLNFKEILLGWEITFFGRVETCKLLLQDLNLLHLILLCEPGFRRIFCFSGLWG